jgi:phosphohistidine phosphatase
MVLVRTLYLLRHAKSSWDDPGLPDRDRLLAPRGRKAARRIAHHLDRERIRPDLVLCSPSARTRETLERIHDAIGDPEVVFDERLYAATDDELLSCLREASAEISSIMLVGHNPGIADLLALLAERGGDLPEAVPTGALATLRFPAGTWQEIGAGGGRLEGFVVPREL